MPAFALHASDGLQHLWWLPQAIPSRFCRYPLILQTVAALQALKLHVNMLTGDTAGPALAVADSIGLPRDDVYAALMPEDKLAFVSSLTLHFPKVSLDKFC